MGVLMAYVGWRSAAAVGRCVGMMAPEAMSRGPKRLRDTAFIGADAFATVGRVWGIVYCFPLEQPTAAEPIRDSAIS